ncbi:type II restriction endonuclease [Bifidobacterium mizhiense]|uniref:type II restriction endonuclease n=1 Tax=Bifidobacterium mizhiense TaxID=2879940 RepID=UPI001E406738|nr:type II restriction endonuclease [Bifidobacterium mizhiense]
MTRDFNQWLATMKPCINRYDYYVNFENVYRWVAQYKTELSLMDSLIGSQDIESKFKDLLEIHPEILKCVPMLLAVRQSIIYTQDEDGVYEYDFENPKYSTDQYVTFMQKTGLFDLIQHHLTNNLFDYALGVNTGLDSNGRKNRGGHQMENLVKNFLENMDVTYFSEMRLNQVEARWNIDLSEISDHGTSSKRWDFVVHTGDTLFLIETNFYTGGGSKLNETARSYKAIAQDVARIEGVEFIWITDGNGWQSARGNLEETFNYMQHLYNIHDLEQGVLQQVFADANNNSVQQS